MSEETIVRQAAPTLAGSKTGNTAALRKLHRKLTGEFLPAALLLCVLALR